MPTPHTLYGAPGWGSTIVEAALAWRGLPFEFVDVAGFDEPGPAHDRLAALNPLVQVPTLQLPDGQVMTESAAIVLHLADTAPDDSLAPPPGSPQRPAFLRRLVWFVAAIYPTITLADYPERWAPGDTEGLRARALANRKDLWRSFEAQFGDGPWTLRDRFSALDIYVAVMTRWTPGRDWFAAQCPKLHACALAAEALEPLAPVFARNFPPEA